MALANPSYVREQDGILYIGTTQVTVYSLIMAWRNEGYSADHNLILLTHDVHTMPQHFADFLQLLPEGAFSPGVWYTPQSLSVGAAILAILETWLCSDHEEYRNRELRLP